MKISNRRILRMDALDLAKIGLYRLVMSEQDDLANIAGSNITSSEPENLFCLSEYKKGEKGCEVKSFDKIKALELLIELGKVEQAKGDDGDAFLESFNYSCNKLNYQLPTKDADENE
ncbi:MAG: hypothetical protein LUC25_07700 [Ruminococcus sp.]|nr:hypothetical protein [Ruminococcus sp.]